MIWFITDWLFLVFNDHVIHYSVLSYYLLNIIFSSHVIHYYDLFYYWLYIFGFQLPCHSLFYFVLLLIDHFLFSVAMSFIIMICLINDWILLIFNDHVILYFDLSYNLLSVFLFSVTLSFLIMICPVFDWLLFLHSMTTYDLSVLICNLYILILFTYIILCQM